MRRAQARWSGLSLAVLCVTLAGCSGSATTQRQATATAPQPTATSAPRPSSTVYFAGKTIASDGATAAETMYALDAATGAVRWSKALGAMQGIYTTAAVGAVYATDGFGVIVALNAADGNLVWQTKGHNAADWQPVADGGALYVGSSGDSSTHGYVDAYSATEGKTLWERDLGVDQSPNLAIAQGTLYVGTQNTLTALHTSDGSVAWTISLPGPASPPNVIGGAIYLNGFGDIRALNTADGSLVWRYTATTRSAEGDDSVSGAAGLVFAGNGPTLMALHASDGSVAWNAALGQLFYGTSVYNGVVYAAPRGNLVAVSAATGAQMWSVTLSGVSGWPPILSDGALLDSRSDGATAQPSGYIYALNPTDGSVLWEFAHPSEVYTNLTVL